MDKTYEKIIVIGYGKIAGEVIKYIHRYRKEYNYVVEYIEHETGNFGSMTKICDALRIPITHIGDKRKVTDYFCKDSARCLIISAGSNYLFPEEVTKSLNYTIINFHNALLPKFPGRNAASWAIFENERETGITWHYVTKQVDAGDIITQKRCRITADERAYELAEKLMQLAFEAFAEKFEEIIEDRIVARKQKVKGKRKLYKSSDIPGMCRFKMEDSPEYIYRLLRAVDYGKAEIFPQVMTTYQGKDIRILRYKKIPIDKVEEKPGRLYLPLDVEVSLRLSWAD